LLLLFEQIAEMCAGMISYFPAAPVITNGKKHSLTAYPNEYNFTSERQRSLSPQVLFAAVGHAWHHTLQ
jgi:hypothetical protein